MLTNLKVTRVPIFGINRFSVSRLPKAWGYLSVISPAAQPNPGSSVVQMMFYSCLNTRVTDSESGSGLGLKKDDGPGLRGLSEEEVEVTADEALGKDFNLADLNKCTVTM